ncbi:hypothetical protein Scep_020661 [Stephania cephalantha]|uniref:Uncharacterized protein n=1 Tax=Stephania cephalantha TaxID=152367 RepID=A0AAP0IDB1_9MAGN
MRGLDYTDFLSVGASNYRTELMVQEEAHELNLTKNGETLDHAAETVDSDVTVGAINMGKSCCDEGPAYTRGNDLLAPKPNFSYKQKADCHESLQAQESNRDSNEAPNVTIYHSDAENNEEKQFMKKGTQNSNQDLDEMPTLTIYHGDQDLDDKPNVTIYHGDQDLGETPNVTIYHGDQDLDDTPNVTIYHGDANTDGDKKFMKDETKDEETQPSVTIYHG